GSDSLFGGGDDDWLLGREGDDYISGESGDDLLDGGSGNDVIVGGSGEDIIRADDGADVLFGNTGADLLDGYEGNDTLIGGQGSDSVSGGVGADVFVFHGLSNDGVALEDEILDFSVTEGDRIDLRGLASDFSQVEISTVIMDVNQIYTIVTVEGDMVTQEITLWGVSDASTITEVAFILG
ncbi:MAG: type I secretion C-terminal target domain-containing protein, partial [Alphaproteobacteria bacterium]|nr:type I secretion C-terminal target domain-containing protein [Alphaproteobacteria bacterium]